VKADEGQKGHLESEKPINTSHDSPSDLVETEQLEPETLVPEWLELVGQESSRSAVDSERDSGRYNLRDRRQTRKPARLMQSRTTVRDKLPEGGERCNRLNMHHLHYIHVVLAMSCLGISHHHLVVVCACVHILK